MPVFLVRSWWVSKTALSMVWPTYPRWCCSNKLRFSLGRINIVKRGLLKMNNRTMLMKRRIWTFTNMQSCIPNNHLQNKIKIQLSWVERHSNHVYSVENTNTTTFIRKWRSLRSNWTARGLSFYKLKMQISASIGPPYYFSEYFGTKIMNVKKYLGGEK